MFLKHFIAIFILFWMVNPSFSQNNSSDIKTAKELLKKVGKGAWQQEEIYYYEDEEEFAEYELTDGWYANMGFDSDYNGAPNPLDYIDLSGLGDALVRNWDDSCNFRASTGEILTTSCGW